MKNIIKQYKIILPSLLVGLLLGWVVFHNSGNEKSSSDQQEQVADGTLWTCSMHPQIQQDKFGLCPICAMDLIPLETTGNNVEGVDPNEISMTASAAKLAEVQTYRVLGGELTKTLYLQGIVAEDERYISEVTARFGGRIEELFVNFTGQKVAKGQRLAKVYSPEILTAQKELQEALKIKDSRPALYQAARSKLVLWSLSDEQIDEIENSKEAVTSFDMLSPISGIVTMRHVALGDYVKVGEQLFKLVDLEHLWVQFDAYESDLPWIKRGSEVSYTLKALPGIEFTGKVVFVDPFINPKTRVAKIRLDVNNKQALLKPEMFANGEVHSKISGGERILVPKSAVLWTGKRSVVYVQVMDRENPSFLMRKVTLGAESGTQYEIIEGLEEGEIIVSNGVFKIDAAAQLRGLPSMMNPNGGMANTVHFHAQTEVIDSVIRSAIVKYDVGLLFQLSLNELLHAYLPMKDAFVLTSAKKVRKAGKKVQPVLEAIDMALLEGDAHMAWMNQVKLMKNALTKIVETKDVEMQRLAFSDFNSGFYGAIKSFGLTDQKVYYQFCPMAFNDQGAYWISNEEIIANPYFGDVMLRCGEVREIIEN